MIVYNCAYTSYFYVKQKHHNGTNFAKHVSPKAFNLSTGNPLESIYPDCSKHTVELFRPEGIAELGLAIVGGNDTPLRNIIVQNVIPCSLVAEDGRILPGDIVIEVLWFGIVSVYCFLKSIKCHFLMSRYYHKMVLRLC